MGISVRGIFPTFNNLRLNAPVLLKYDWSNSSSVKVLSSDQAISRFGAATAISGDGSTMVVGAPQYQSNRGEAFIYRWNGSTWQFKQRIDNPQGFSNAYFGISVSISYNGNDVVIGCSGASVSNTPCGAAYVYRTTNGTTWSLNATLSPDNRENQQRFGVTVAMSADGLRVVVGSNTYGGSYQYGALYSYTKIGSTWGQRQFIENPYQGVGAQMGYRLKMTDDGSTVVTTSKTGSDEITIYIYSLNGSTYEVYKTFTRNASSLSQINIAISKLTNDTMFVGDGFSNTVWIYRKTGLTWKLLTHVTPPDAKSFNGAVGTDGSGSVVIAGATSNSGHVFVNAQGIKWSAVDTFSGLISTNDAISLTLDGNIAAIGASGDNTSRGSVIVYTAPER